MKRHNGQDYSGQRVVTPAPAGRDGRGPGHGRCNCGAPTPEARPWCEDCSPYAQQLRAELERQQEQRESA